MFAELGHVLGKAADRVLAYPCIVLAEVVGPKLAARDYLRCRRDRFAEDALIAAEAECEVVEVKCGAVHPIMADHRCVREVHGVFHHRCGGTIWSDEVVLDAPTEDAARTATQSETSTGAS